MSAAPAPAPRLADLVVLDRLEVGPVRLEPRSLRARYRVQRGSESSESELGYRFEQDVFTPGEPASENLAAMLAAQVALNYGLFANELVLHGPLDGHDRRFLEEMARNTAREIYVNKLLKPNPFLRPPAVGLEPERRGDYLAASLRFPDAAEHELPAWSGERSRHAVLASGGKESLLSQALLEELAYETHAIFVNESGRHWHTALNGYRHLHQRSPDTTVRVWTSADRVFSWMLRQLPFVRPDFARLRADAYPIRLWTVAVFVFGALPVLRQRHIGRLVIGDEHDTSRRLSHRGISHYDGLYDQSRWFDEALSRYYRAKGFGVCQFSLLRPLSELLVEQTLAGRYPELQRHQVSCHAAHMDGERVRPCGRCEKCRRVVGMLTAVGADPGACGYDADQIEACLAALSAEGVHQEAEAAEHTLWLLESRGRIEPTQPSPRPRPEVMKLRFHQERSPLNAIPTDLRRGLYPLLLEHAEGAVMRRGRSWAPFDPLGAQSLSRPYPYEPARAGAGGEQGERDWLLGELSWPRAQARLRETDTALLPVGSIEQHGPHLPLDTDAWDAEHLSRLVAERCGSPRPLVLPLIPYGVAYHHIDFAGTISVNPETLSRLVYEVGISATRHGITKLVIVNGHGGNVPALQYAAQMINRDAHIFTCVESGETSDADIAELCETSNDVHAGEIETSTTLATRPELVDMSQARRSVPRFSSQYLNFSSARSVEWYAHTSRISSSGVLGDPTRASREKGERIWRLMVDHLVAFIEAIKPLTVEEIHQRRY